MGLFFEASWTQWKQFDLGAIFFFVIVLFESGHFKNNLVLRPCKKWTRIFSCSLFSGKWSLVSSTLLYLLYYYFLTHTNIHVLFYHLAHNFGFWLLLTEMPSYMKGVLKFDMKKNALLSALPYLAMLLLSYFFSFLSGILERKNCVPLKYSRKFFNTIGEFLECRK